MSLAPYVFNVADGDGDRVAALLAAKMWAVGPDEPHRDALGPGDHALIYLAAPKAIFIGRAEVATTVHDWSPSEADSFPGDSRSGVLLSSVERWEPAVPMDAVVQRIDPSGVNPLVRANAEAGFRWGIVRITDHEYGAALAARRDARATG